MFWILDWDKNNNEKNKPEQNNWIFYGLGTASLNSMFQGIFLIGGTPFFLDVDPTYFLFKMLLPGSEFGYTFRVIRSLLLASLGYHWNAAGVQAFIHLFSCCKMLTDILKRLLISSEKSVSNDLFVHSTFQRSIRIYKEPELIVTRLNSIIPLASGLVIFAATGWFVLSATCSIKYFGRVPTVPYIGLPGTAILAAGLVGIFISSAGKIHTLTESFIENHKTIMTIRKSKFCSRVLRSLNPLGMEVGGLLTFTKKSTFILFSIWMDCTINLLIGT